jgi:M6 family metalloprotease-like protein
MNRRKVVLLFILAGRELFSVPLSKVQTRFLPAPHTAVSERNLVGSAPFKWMNGRLVENHTQSQAATDTIRILAVMAEFKPDSDVKTTGDGKFDITLSGNTTIDSPPHDFQYFQNQMLALSNYYRSVSEGKLIVTATVFPEIVALKREMGYYNSGTTGNALDKGLAELFRDAIMAADSAGAVFTGNDAFVVFHAGVGKDVDVGLDTSPKDIPSVFLKLDDFRKHIAGNQADYLGIPVQKGKFMVPEGILLPETESQDGYEIGLLGTAALMLGFQLGMPAMWNTQTGRTGIGRWGLMDQGSGNFNGLIPAEPDAFCKMMRGWEKPIEVRQGENLRVACSAAKQPGKMYKIPISENEYFLIENRSHDPDGNGVAFGWDDKGNRVRFTADGQIEAEKPFGVIVRVDEYDFALPGSGILIWHVDENAVLARMPENNINSDKNHRGVDLEEADGAQDIGEAYGLLDGGSGSETGVMHDAWYADNEIHKLANASDDVVFSPQTHPNSLSYSGANSHIVLYGFPKIDTVMSFSLKTDLLHAGFPRYFLQKSTPYPPMQGDLNGDGKKELIVATQEGKVFAWSSDGSKVIPNHYTTERISISRDTLRFPVALFCNPEGPIDVQPVLGKEYGNGRTDLLHIAAGERVSTYTVLDGNMDGMADVSSDTVLIGKHINGLVHGSRIRFESTTEGSVYSSKVVIPNNVPVQKTAILELGNGTQLVIAYQNGKVTRMHFPAGQWTQDWKEDYNALLQTDETISAFSVGSNSGGTAFVVFMTNAGRALMLDFSGDAFEIIPEGFLEGPSADIALGDLDADGQMEMVVTAGGQIFAFNLNGTLVNGYPVPRQPRPVVLSSPVLGDVDGDGDIEVFCATSQGNIEAWKRDGSAMEGFPLVIGGEIPVTPLLSDLDGDGLIELAAVSDGGVVMVWDMRGKWNNQAAPWPEYLHDSGHTASNIQDYSEPSPSADWMPGNLVYNYPNPNIEDRTVIRYRLEQAAAVTIRIFDMTGDIVKNIKGPGLGKTENEAIWNLTGVSSGVYFCRVTATGDVWEKSVTFKIAVVK